MPYGYDIRANSEQQVTLANNAAASATITPPTGAQAVQIGVVTTDVWLAYTGTPSATLGQVYKKDQNPVLVPGVEPFKVIPTTNAATVVNLTWLF